MKACEAVRQVQDLDVVWRSILLDIPGLLFFSTYTLLVLFWAEIYHQARQLPTSTLRPTFIISNVVVYVIQVRAFSPTGFWVPDQSYLNMKLNWNIHCPIDVNRPPEELVSPTLTPHRVDEQPFCLCSSSLLDSFTRSESIFQS